MDFRRFGWSYFLKSKVEVNFVLYQQVLSPSKSLDRGMNDLAPNSHTPKKSGGGQSEYFATPNR